MRKRVVLISMLTLANISFADTYIDSLEELPKDYCISRIETICDDEDITKSPSCLVRVKYESNDLEEATYTLENFNYEFSPEDSSETESMWQFVKLLAYQTVKPVHVSGVNNKAKVYKQNIQKSFKLCKEFKKYKVETWIND